MADPNISHENDRKLDEMLDAMLSAYSSVDPRPGLERRILANVQEQTSKNAAPAGLRWSWAVVALAAVALIMMAIYVSRLQTRPRAPQIANHQQSPAKPQEKFSPVLQEHSLPSRKVAASYPSTRRHSAQIARITRPAADHVIAVKQDVFPSPSPLSEQEKLLLRYLSGTPREELIAQSRPDPPDESDDDDIKDPKLQNLTQVPQRNSNTR